MTRLYLDFRLRLFTAKLSSSSDSQEGPIHHKLCEANFKGSHPQNLTIDEYSQPLMGITR